MSAKRAAQKMQEIAATLNGVAARWQKRHGGEMPGACLHDAVDRRTPATELEAKEARLGMREPTTMPLFDGAEDGERMTPFAELEEQVAKVSAENEEAVRIWLEANAWLLDFLFAEGPHPAVVMRRLYAWVKKFRPEAIWDMGYRDLAKLLDESHAAMEWRIGVLLDDYARAKGVTGVKAPWQRTAEACRAYSDVQQGNSNRLGGKRASKHKARKGKSQTKKP